MPLTNVFKKKEIVKSLENTFCRLRPSKIAGVGVFAIKNIPQGTELFIGQHDHNWPTFNMKELQHLDPEVLSMIDDFFVIEADQTVNIPLGGLNGMDMSFYINHSKNPNTVTYDDGFTFHAVRDIKKGEEITTAYGVYDHKYS